MYVPDPLRRPKPDRDAPRAPRRRLLLTLAVAGFAIAVYLTLYQVGVFPGVWDPLFGEASSRVVLGLTDPVPDAAAGVLAYATEILLLIATSTSNLPWRLLALGLVLSIGAVVSIVLIVVQPAVAHRWCLPCLCSAALSLALFALGIGEARAAAARVRRAVEHGVALKDALRGVDAT